MSVKNDAFPSSVAFEEIHRVLSTNEATRKDAIDKAKTVFAFTLKNAKGETQSWYIDLLKTGTVGLGASPPGGKAEVTLSLADSDFLKLVEGKAKPQQLFMSGKLKVKGNIMKATKLEPILNASRSQSKL